MKKFTDASVHSHLTTTKNLHREPDHHKPKERQHKV